MKLVHSRPEGRGCSVLFALILFVAPLIVGLTSRPAAAAEKTRLRVDDYQIDAELLPQTHRIVAKAKVKFTALEDISVASFQLNNGLRITKLTDASNRPLSPERITQESTVRFGLNSGLAKDGSTTVNFEYEGTLESADDSPVQGLKLAYIGPDTSYLLYSGLWFPVSDYGINRFTALISITVPSHMTVIGSGRATLSTPAKKGESSNTKTYTFGWGKPSFPGTIIAGTFQEFKTDEAGLDLHVFFKPVHQTLGAEYASTAIKEFTYFITQYGLPPSQSLKVVEIPDDTVPAAWAPEPRNS